MWFKSECNKISDRLWDYTAQRLSASETTQVETHLQQCAKCQAEAEAYRQTLGLLGAARSMPVPASQTTWRDLRPQLTPAPKPITRSADWLPRLTLAGAGTAMAATLLVVFLSSGRHPGGIANSVNPPQHGSQPDVTAPDPDASSGDGTTIAENNAEPSDNGGGTYDPTKFFSGAAALTWGGGSHRNAPVPSPAPREVTPSHRLRPHATHLAGNSGHTKKATLPTPQPTAQVARLDGSNVTPRAQQNYVLKPVSASSDDETTRHYVISSIPVSNGSSAIASNGDGDEGRAW